MKNLKRLMLAGLVLSGSACAADLPSAAHPEPNAPAFNTAVDGSGGSADNGGDVPSFATEQDARNAFPDGPQIIWAHSIVEFDGNNVKGSADMNYSGNWAEMRMRLAAHNPLTSEKTAEGRVHEQSFWQVYGKIFSAPRPIEVALLGPACGGAATNTVQFTAKWHFVVRDVKWVPSELDEVSYPVSKTERQPECPPEDCPAGYTGGNGAQWMSYWVGNSYECEQDKDEPASNGGGGGECPECLDRPVVTYCNVTYSYWKDTGEIFHVQVNWCM